MVKKVQTDPVSKDQSVQQGVEARPQKVKGKKKLKRRGRSYKEYYNTPPKTFEALESYIPKEGNSPKGGRPPLPAYQVINALHFMAKAGCPWRALPEERFGSWATIYSTYRRWLAKGFFHNIFNILSKNADLSKIMIDGSIVKAHKHAAGAAHNSPGPPHQDIGLSRGGLSTKIHAVVDAQGRPIKFALTPGNVNDIVMAPALLENLHAGTVVLADKGYDSNALVDQLKSQGCKVVIPPRSNRNEKRELDETEYNNRHHVENFFDKVKEFRRISSRYEKLSHTYYGFLLFSSAFVWLASYKLDIKKEDYLAL